MLSGLLWDSRPGTAPWDRQTQRSPGLIGSGCALGGYVIRDTLQMTNFAEKSTDVNWLVSCSVEDRLLNY